jgi:uncharacterized membrane protein
MKLTQFVYSALIGVVASCRSMTPMAAIAAAHCRAQHNGTSFSARPSVI